MGELESEQRWDRGTFRIGKSYLIHTAKSVLSMLLFPCVQDTLFRQKIPKNGRFSIYLLLFYLKNSSSR
jgi:hypothetical protein